MAHDVFISYAFEDEPTAAAASRALEDAGLRCWIAPRDILPGDAFSEAIIRALGETRVMVLVFSPTANESPHVLREVAQAVNRDIPIITLRITRVPLSPAMQYYLSTPHWLDALAPPIERHLGRLVETVRRQLERGARRPSIGPETTPAEQETAGFSAPPARLRTTISAPIVAAFARQPIVIGVAAVVIAAAGMTATSLGGRPGQTSTTLGPSGAPSFDALGPATTGPSESRTASPSPLVTPIATPYVPAVAIEPLFDAPGDWVGGIAWDGTDVWVAGGAELFRVAEDGRVLGVFEPPDYSPEGLTWDGDRFWLFTTNAGAVYRFSVDRSRPTARPTVAKVIESPIRTIGGGANHGLAWDGSGLWLSDFYNVYRLDTTGKVLTTLAFGDEVNGLAWDGRRLWIAVNHLPIGDATLVALDPEGRATATYEIPVVEVFSMTWAGDAFLVAAAFELAGEPRLWRVEILGETTP